MSAIAEERTTSMVHAGHAMYALIEELYPICRSITGNGVRQTLSILQKHIPLHVHEVPSGTQVFDWTIPQEWNIRDAWVRAPDGNKIIDFKKSNLHVVGYSEPVRCRVSLAELKKHLHSNPEHPDWIPYRTSYYSRTWGFCLPHNQLVGLEEGEYEVLIDSSLSDGSLTYGEYLLEGETKDEVLISCHVCHPSLCNDNLSGIALSVFLAKAMARAKTRYSYRFLFIPGTIGSVTWLKRNETSVHRIRHGLVVVCVGDSGPFTYKRSRDGNREIDRAVINVLESSGKPYKIIGFSPYGYDERQYCSPGFNLRVGSLSRSSHGAYPEYHTSADNLDRISPNALEESISVYREVMSTLEKNCVFRNLKPKCEPQLGKYGLYQSVGGTLKSDQSFRMALLWVLNYSDGRHDLLDIADRSGIAFNVVSQAAEALTHHGLLVECEGPAC